MIALMDENPSPPSIESRIEKIEKEMRGLRKFVTTLETGHESRARDWNRKIAALAHDVDDLKSVIRKTKKKIKKLVK